MLSCSEQLGLSVETVPANDPFFGRAGKLMGASQREKAAKFELVAEITSPSPGAISSGNYHGDHFGKAFDISLPGGDAAHSSCFGFGLERITLALLHVTAWTLRRGPLRCAPVSRLDSPCRRFLV